MEEVAINPTIKLPELTQNWGNKLLEVKVKLLSHVQLFTIPWTIVYQASLSMGSSRQEYWSGLPFPAHSVPPTLQQATTDQHLHWRHLDTHGKSESVLLWGHCSFLLGRNAHKVLFVSSNSLFPQSFVSSGGSIMGLMVTSSKRAYAIPRSAAPRAPAPAAIHC